MDKNLRNWITTSALLSVALVAGSRSLEGGAPLPERAGLRIAAMAGVALMVFVIAIALGRRHLLPLLDAPPRSESRHAAWPRLTLFLASFVALFLEMVLIRYTGSQLRIFSFYKNVPLIAAYLGLGLGCALGAGQPRHAMWLLLWSVPLLTFLAEGTLVCAGILSRMAATASSEHMLGDAAITGLPPAFVVLAEQIGMGSFCVVTLFVVASFFIPIGRLLGDAFEKLPRLAAYSVNILGSLAGTVAFVLLGRGWTPPWSWMLIGLLPLLWWVEGRRHVLLGAGLVVLSVVAVMPSVGDTIWSPYQKLVGQEITFPVDGGGGVEMPGYLVEISDVFYQVAVDLRPEAVARVGQNPYPHYDDALRMLPRPPRRVLIVGSGTGNDVAAALRAGATQVDAVDIDPAIVALGRRHHPERPYDDPRVRVIVDDARAAFRQLPAGQYDAVVFGLLDSHTQLGLSSVRLDNYVFTQESFASARRLLAPGGALIVTAATFRDWFRQRFVDLLAATCDSSVQTKAAGLWVTYVCRVDDPEQPPIGRLSAATLPSDDWPFLYLPERGIPRAYLLAVVLLVAGSLRVVRFHGLSATRFDAYHGHLFCLGAAFMLMEVFAINRLALLFGTTWIVSAVAVMVVLTLIIAANFTVALAGALPYALAYAGLAASLTASVALDPAAVLGQGLTLSILYGFVALLPVYFAGLVFARSFERATEAGPAIGANMLGAVVGGWAEYSSMALGIRALALVALVFYAGSLLCLIRVARHNPHAVPLPVSRF